jgi:peptidoglycan/xylan/chitin deacetylase (PgdA/CDA1 family)
LYGRPVTDPAPVRLHGVACPALGSGELVIPGSLRPLVGPLQRIVARVSGPGELLDEAGGGLPRGAAWAEAVAIRLRRRGTPLAWGAPDVLDRRAIRELVVERGRSSVCVVRADPGLLTEMQLGGWFNASLRGRLGRRALVRAGSGAATATVRGRALLWTLDAAFWHGARREASTSEWRRLTSSYVALIYHRMAGEARPGQEQLDVPAGMFLGQMRLLRLLGYHALDEEELLDFHADPAAALPRRSYALTVDDGFADCVRPLTEAACHRPQLFVPTGAVGGRADWAAGERIAGWDELAGLERVGVRIGSHANAHAFLPALEADAVQDQLQRSLAELRERLDRPSAMLAYPHGGHDERVRDAASGAGYRAAWTTEVGRNGAGTDPYCLRRVGIKARDSRASFLWKVISGELLPRRWESRRRAT